MTMEALGKTQALFELEPIANYSACNRILRAATARYKKARVYDVQTHFDIVVVAVKRAIERGEGDIWPKGQYAQ